MGKLTNNDLKFKCLESYGLKIVRNLIEGEYFPLLINSIDQSNAEDNNQWDIVTE